MKRGLLLVIAGLLGAFSPSVNGQDGKPRELTAAAKKTLEILETEKFDTINLDEADQHQTFKLIKERLDALGIVVRIKNYGEPRQRQITPVPWKLRNVPIRAFMRYFDEWAGWGWILYDDGSITYFNAQCGCCWPKDGLHFHAGQFEAGKPENMAKEQADRAGKDERAEPGDSP